VVELELQKSTSNQQKLFLVEHKVLLTQSVIFEAKSLFFKKILCKTMIHKSNIL